MRCQPLCWTSVWHLAWGQTCLGYRLYRNGILELTFNKYRRGCQHLYSRGYFTFIYPLEELKCVYFFWWIKNVILSSKYWLKSLSLYIKKLATLRLHLFTASGVTCCTNSSRGISHAPGYCFLPPPRPIFLSRGWFTPWLICWREPNGHLCTFVLLLLLGGWVPKSKIRPFFNIFGQKMQSRSTQQDACPHILVQLKVL